MATSIAQQIGDLARTYQQAVESVMSKLPEATKKALSRRLAKGDVAWALSLILAGWRLPLARKGTDGDELARFLTSSGAQEVVKQIAGLESQFPANFRSFLASAEDGSLGAAGEYFAATISALGIVARTVLHSWLEKIDAPASGLASAVAASQQTESRSPPPAGTSARGTDAGRPSQPRPVLTVQKQTPADPEPPAVPDDPDQATFVGAYLISIGWKVADISRILVGPKQAHRTAEQVFAQWAALHGTDREVVRSRLQQLHPDRIEPIVAGDIVPSAVRPSDERIDAEALYGLYRDLPPAQQGRLLLLLSMTPKGSQTPIVDESTQAPPIMPVAPATPPAPPTQVVPKTPRPTPEPPKSSKPPQPQPKLSQADTTTDVVIPIVKGGIELVSQLIKDALKESKTAPVKGGGGSDSGSSPPTQIEPQSGGDGRMTERSEYFPDGIDEPEEAEAGGGESEPDGGGGGESEPMQDYQRYDEADGPLPDVMEA